MQQVSDIADKATQCTVFRIRSSQTCCKGGRSV